MKDIIKEIKENSDAEWAELYSYGENDRRSNIQDMSNIVCKFFGNDMKNFIDVGPGHPASEAWCIKDALPHCNVYGFEPSSTRYDLLLEKNYPGELQNIALTSKIGTIKCAAGVKGGKSDYVTQYSNRAIDAGLYELKDIESTTVDSVVKQKDLTNCVLWADIEGAELDMLKGAKKALESKAIIALVLELNVKRSFITENHCNYKEVIAFLSEYGFGLSPTTVMTLKKNLQTLVTTAPYHHSVHFDAIFYHKDDGAFLPEVTRTEGKIKLKYDTANYTFKEKN